MKILVKFPSRERPVKFGNTLRKYIELSINRDNIHYFITLDDTDASLPQYQRILSSINNDYPEVKISMVVDRSNNKIHAINRDMEKFNDWDILVLASDDMIPQVEGWDIIVKVEMQRHFNNSDGVLWFWDGDPATRKTVSQYGLNTLCILGKNYFDRFGYIYQPEYVSLWSDNEFMMVADKLGKQIYIDHCIIKHIHPSNTQSVRPDRLMSHTQSFFKTDEKTYRRREQINFGLQ